MLILQAMPLSLEATGQIFCL